MSEAEGDAHSGGSEENAEAENESDNLQVTQVWLVRQGKVMWLPDTQCVQGIIFFKVSKWDHKLTHLALGKPKQMHSRKEQNSMGKLAFFSTMVERRNQRET